MAKCLVLRASVAAGATLLLSPVKIAQSQGGLDDELGKFMAEAEKYAITRRTEMEKWFKARTERFLIQVEQKEQEEEGKFQKERQQAHFRDLGPQMRGCECEGTLTLKRAIGIAPDAGMQIPQLRVVAAKRADDNIEHKKRPFSHYIV